MFLKSKFLFDPVTMVWLRSSWKWMFKILCSSIRKLCPCQRASQIPTRTIYRGRHAGLTWMDSAEYFDSNSKGKRNSWGISKTT